MNRLQLAQEFEDAIGRLWNGNKRLAYPKHEYSCLAIDDHDVYWMVGHLILSNKEFKDYLSPDFGIPRGYKRQYARALWLTLLAHLAEEGALTLEGLK